MVKNWFGKVVTMALLASTGCCSWCEHHCPHAAAAPAACAPVAPVCAPVCCPTGTAPSGYVAPQASTNWQAPRPTQPCVCP